MFDEAELRRMSPKERAKLMRALAVLDMPRLSSPGSTRRRKLFLLGTIVCCVVLAVWIGVLAVTLPRYYRAGGWRGAWVGFDVAELAAFAATAWAAWRGRQVLIMCLTVLATLLLCDSWFDVTLNLRTSGFLCAFLLLGLELVPLLGDPIDQEVTGQLVELDAVQLASDEPGSRLELLERCDIYRGLWYQQNQHLQSRPHGLVSLRAGAAA